MNSIAGLFGRVRSPQGLCVDCDDYEAGSMHFTATWQKWLVTQVEQRMPRVGRLVTVNTQFMHQKLIDWGVSEDKILYLPNGVDSERFSQTDAAKIDELRQSFGLTGRHVVAYIGSMSLPSHPVDLLLNAFSLILNWYPESKLLLVGGGGDYPAIVEMAAQMGLGSSVVFTGRVAPQDVPLLYQLADVTVDPVYDNDAARGRSPLKLFESWASSVPFVTSRVGDRTSLLGTSLAGMLTDDCTAEAYAKSIMDVLSSAKLAEALCTRGLIEVKQYTWEHLAARLERAYKNLL